MNRVLVAGGAGFIGSHFTRTLVKEGFFTLCIDKLTYAGNTLNLKDIENAANFEFFRVDIRQTEVIDKAVKQYKINTIVNFAAETHVDRSILNPEVFYNTNIEGAISLFEIAKKHGIRILQVSTDEVYGAIEKGKADETSKLNPTSPYAASKASADLIGLSYYKTYGLDIVITRSSNNFGPNQYPEKFIPVIIMSLMQKRRIPIYGSGRQKRDWIYVTDNVRAIRDVLFHGKTGQVYNIGSGTEIQNIQLVEKIIEIYEEITKEKNLTNLITFVKDRPAHDIRYALSTSKIERELNFKPSFSFELALKETVKWYLNNQDWINSIKTLEFEEYYKKNYDER